MHCSVGEDFVVFGGVVGAFFKQVCCIEDFKGSQHERISQDGCGDLPSKVQAFEAAASVEAAFLADSIIAIELSMP